MRVPASGPPDDGSPDAVHILRIDRVGTIDLSDDPTGRGNDTMTHAVRTTRTPARMVALGALALAGQIGQIGMAGTAHAQSFDTLDRLSQDQFESLVTNLGSATGYKALAPGEPLGVLGFDLAAGLSVTETDDELFELAGSDALDLLVVPRLSVQKGLPAGLDIGAYVGALADSDATLLGVEGRYAILDGGILTPSLGLRLAATRLLGADELDLENYSAELVLSKGFVMLTPYAGIGIVRTVGEAKGVENLDEVGVNEEKLLLGLNVNLGINLGFEADVSGGNATYSAKIGFRF